MTTFDGDADRWTWQRMASAILVNTALGRIAQRESARFTRGRSLVRSQVRPLEKALETGPFFVPALGR
jgi:hypothetical protein